jgi:hypothetical protein
LQAGEALAGTSAQCPACLGVTVVPPPALEDEKPRSDKSPHRVEWNNNLLSLPRVGNPFAFCHGSRRCHDADLALALGLFGMLLFGLPSPITIFFGIRAVRRLRGSEEDRPGWWEAVAGLTLGVVQATGIAVLLLLLVLAPALLP